MPDDHVRVGRVGRPHGLDGSFFIEHPSETRDRFEVGASLWVAGEAAKVVGARQARGRPIVKLDRAVPRGAWLTVPRAALPAPGEDSYYTYQLVGLEVVEEGGRPLGRVQEVAPGVANDVLELDSGLALPMHEACVREIDLDAGTIVVAPGFTEST